MLKALTHVTVIVPDQDAALRFYTEKLGMVKRADQPFGDGARWLSVAPSEQDEVEIILHEPSLGGGTPTEEAVQYWLDRRGKATMWVFSTDDCQAAYEEISARGVTFVSPPERMPWGIQAIFQDLYGNPYLMVEQPRGN